MYVWKTYQDKWQSGNKPNRHRDNIWKVSHVSRGAQTSPILLKNVTLFQTAITFWKHNNKSLT